MIAWQKLIEGYAAFLVCAGMFFALGAMSLRSALRLWRDIQIVRQSQGNPHQ